jgi:hypothetical protein
MVWLVLAVVLVGLGAALVLGYLGLVTGALTVDVGWGRRVRALGPLTVSIAAARGDVFDLLAQPYLGRTTRALREKVEVCQLSRNSPS